MSPDVRQLLLMDGWVPAEPPLAEKHLSSARQGEGGGGRGGLVRCPPDGVIALSLAVGSRKADRQPTGLVFIRLAEETHFH